MKYYALICTSIFFILFNSCKKNDDPIIVAPQEVGFNLTFKATYNGLPLEKNKTYDYDTYKVQFSQFNTYLSDIKLLNGAAETLLSEVEFVNFTPDFATDDKAVDVTVKVTALEGDYTGMKIGYGVKPALNAKKPADFASGHPLNKEVEYWPGWKSYIFNKIEGQGDSNGDGLDDIFMIFHCGSDKVYREYSFEKAITVAADKTLTVELDLKKVFYADNAWWDMTIDNNQYTSNLASDTRVAAILMGNFDNATAIK